MMTDNSLSIQVQNQAKKRIRDLLSLGLGVRGGGPSLALDVRGFHLKSDAEMFRVEFLLNSDDPIAFIDEHHAYSTNGHRANLNWIVLERLEPLSDVLDALDHVAKRDRRYEVTLRALIISEDEAFINNHPFDYPSCWTVSDHKCNDGVLSVRLDTTVTIWAPSITEAIQVAIDEPPSLGIQDMTDQRVQVNIEYWVDPDLPDVRLIG